MITISILNIFFIGTVQQYGQPGADSPHGLVLRLFVGPVAKRSFPALLGLRGDMRLKIDESLKIHAHELSFLQAEAEDVDVPKDVVSMLCDLREFCIAHEIGVSDRRWRKIVKLLQVSAASNGRPRVSIWDCWILQHCLWETPEESELIYQWYAERVGASAAMDPSRLMKIVVSWEAKLKADKNSRTQVCDSKGRLLYRSEGGRRTTKTTEILRSMRGKKPLFLAPADAIDRHGTRIKDRSNGDKATQWRNSTN